MFDWIVSTQPYFVVGVACSFLVIGDNVLTLEAAAVPEKPAYVIAQFPVVMAEELQRAIRFQTLREQWHIERGVTSSIQEMCTTPAYLTIVGMGKLALPLLIAQLRSEGDKPDHWFFALRCITGADPIAPEDKGRMTKMAKAWLAWADEQGDNVR